MTLNVFHRQSDPLLLFDGACACCHAECVPIKRQLVLFVNQGLSRNRIGKKGDHELAGFFKFDV